VESRDCRVSREAALTSSAGENECHRERVSDSDMEPLSSVHSETESEHEGCWRPDARAIRKRQPSPPSRTAVLLLRCARGVLTEDEAAVCPRHRPS